MANHPCNCQPCDNCKKNTLCSNPCNQLVAKFVVTGNNPHCACLNGVTTEPLLYNESMIFGDITGAWFINNYITCFGPVYIRVGSRNGSYFAGFDCNKEPKKVIESTVKQCGPPFLATFVFNMDDVLCPCKENNVVMNVSCVIPRKAIPKKKVDIKFF